MAPPRRLDKNLSQIIGSQVFSGNSRLAWVRSAGCSDANKNSGITWSEASLTEHLKDPNATPICERA